MDKTKIGEKVGAGMVNGLVGAVSASFAGSSFKSVAESYANYSAHVDAITQKVYSAADKVTPEIVAQANNLIEQTVASPSLYQAVGGVLLTGLSFYCFKRFAEIFDDK